MIERNEVKGFLQGALKLAKNILDKKNGNIEMRYVYYSSDNGELVFTDGKNMFIFRLGDFKLNVENDIYFDIFDLGKFVSTDKEIIVEGVIAYSVDTNFRYPNWDRIVKSQWIREIEMDAFDLFTFREILANRGYYGIKQIINFEHQIFKIKNAVRLPKLKITDEEDGLYSLSGYMFLTKHISCAFEFISITKVI